MISEQMAAELPTEMAMTRRLLSLIPPDKMNWQPADGMQTIGWNANHLVDILAWTDGILNQNEWDIAPADGDPDATPNLTDPEELLKRFDKVASQAIQALQGVEDTAMAEPWSLKMTGQILFTMNRGDCIRKWVFGHSAHHRGILSVYIRLAGVPVASVYEQE